MAAIWSLNCFNQTQGERNDCMNKPKRQWNVTLVDVLVGFAVLMILSALVVPIFFPPVGRAASRAAASPRSSVSVNH